MPDPLDYLSLNKTAPAAIPREGRVHLFFNRETGKLSMKLEDGTVTSPSEMTQEEILAALEGSQITVDGLSLADQADSAQAPPEGQVVLIGNQLALGNGEDIGGSIIYDRSRTFGDVGLLSAAYNASGHREVLARIPIPRRFAALGQKISVFGGFEIYHNGGEGQYGSNIGFVTEVNKDDGTIGSSQGFPTAGLTGRSSFPFVSCEMTAQAVVGDASKIKWGITNGQLFTGFGPSSASKITGTSPASAPVAFTSASVSGPVGTEAPGDTDGSDDQTTDINEAFYLYLVLDVLADTGGTNVNVRWDFTVRGVEED